MRGLSDVPWKRCVVAAMVWGVLPTPVHAAVDPAYRALLATHVRPGTIGGTRLALVDYRAVQRDPQYPAALRALAEAKPDQLTDPRDRFAFWINAYNLLAIKVVLDQYPTRSIRDGGSLLRPIWKKPAGIVAGREVSLDEVEHGILRKQFRNPRVHSAIVCASVSCPDLRAEPYEGGRLDAQLDDAARRFLANPAKGLVPGADGATAKVSSIFDWFAGDFAAGGGVATFLRRYADPGVAARLAGLTDRGLSYLPYDWSLNDTARDGS